LRITASCCYQYEADSADLPQPQSARCRSDDRDSCHDAAIIGRLRGIHIAAEPICPRLTTGLPRYQTYQTRPVAVIAHPAALKA
jgi:hypothetical protein